MEKDDTGELAPPSLDGQAPRLGGQAPIPMVGAGLNLLYLLTHGWDNGIRRSSSCIT